VRRGGLRLRADEEHWIPLSDLMTGLMFLFLIIALAYMAQAKIEENRAKTIAVTYDRVRQQLYQDLDREFHDDLIKWGANLDEKTLSIRFKEPEVLFEVGSDRLRPKFTNILNDFFPRYVHILTEPKYVNAIGEVRIEGYTSTIWHPGASTTEAYIGNMELSQSRTRSVLNYVLAVPSLEADRPWLMEHVTANGLSFSHLIKVDGREDQQQSQRVEFRVRTDADEQLRRILALPQ
jgi:outer membrane protein OmpA-like peptidoglycan-associated protein